MFKNQDLLNEVNGLKKFSNKLSQNPADAEDLLQATLLKALEKKHMFEDGTNLFGWTSKIMYNMFVTDYHRRTKFQTRYDPETYILNQSIDAPQDDYVELRQIKHALHKLSEEHRHILHMVCVKGMKYGEVSEALQIPVGTVRSRMSRARENLNAIMAQQATATAKSQDNIPEQYRPRTSEQKGWMVA